MTIGLFICLAAEQKKVKAKNAAIRELKEETALKQLLADFFLTTNH